MTDPIADMLVRLSNANHKLKETVDIPASKMKVEIARILKEEGYISNYRVAKEKGHGTLRLNLKFSPAKDRIIHNVKRISRPGLRIYRGCGEIPVVQNGLGTAILSTPKGVMTGDAAREKKIGGEVLCLVW